MRATELWAKANGEECWGDQSCHWCSAPCQPGCPHDDLPPVPFVRSRSNALRPGNPWICVGCQTFRRKRQSVRFLDGNCWRDGQCPLNHSWFLTEKEARSIRIPFDGFPLYKRLLSPPKAFVLALIDKEENRPHQWAVNQKDEWQAGDEIKFTLNNVVFSYTPYELELALTKRKARTPGVDILIDKFGPYPPLEKKPEEPENKLGTPKVGGGPKKVVG